MAGEPGAIMEPKRRSGGHRGAVLVSIVAAGLLAAIEAGYIQREIQESAYRHQKAVEAQERIVVGVNRFRVAEDHKPELLRVDEAVQKAQVERLRQLRAGRDSFVVECALTDLQKAAEGDENLVPLILEAVEAYATTGEICNALRRVFGEYDPVTTLEPIDYTEEV